MATISATAVVGADPRLVEPCIESLIASAGQHELDITVIDNDRVLSPGFAEQFNGLANSVRVVENEIPLGFATNHNRGAAESRADYLLLANDDLVFCGDAVAACVDFLERKENAEVAALSPRLLNTDGSLQRSTYAFPTVFRALLDLSGLRQWIPHNTWTDRIARAAGLSGGRSRFWSHDRTCDVDTFRGAAMFVRRKAWLDTGELCEVARVGGEIAEWHRRCIDKGWRVVYFPEAEVIHHGSRTVGTNPLLRSEYLKGYLIFFERHKSAASAILFRSIATLISIARIGLSSLSRDSTGRDLWLQNLRVVTSPLATGDNS